MTVLNQTELRNTQGGFLPIIAAAAAVAGAIYLIGSYVEDLGSAHAALECHETCNSNG